MGQAELQVENTAVYHPRNPKDSALWNLLDQHYENFELNYHERFEKEYGFFRSIISEVVHAYLKCGDLKEGFARVQCPDCKHEFLLSFSCRGRWFRSLVPRLPAPHVMRKKLSFLENTFETISFIQCLIANMFSVSPRFSESTSNMIVNSWVNFVNAQIPAS